MSHATGVVLRVPCSVCGGGGFVDNGKKDGTADPCRVCWGGLVTADVPGGFERLMGVLERIATALEKKP